MTIANEKFDLTQLKYVDYTLKCRSLTKLLKSCKFIFEEKNKLVVNDNYNYPLMTIRNAH